MRMWCHVAVASSWTYLWINWSVVWPNSALLAVPASSVPTIIRSTSRVHPRHCTHCRTDYRTRTNLRQGTGNSICASEAAGWNFSNPVTISPTLFDWTWATQRSRPLPTTRGDRCLEYKWSICPEIDSPPCRVFYSGKTWRSGGLRFMATRWVVSASSAGWRTGWGRSGVLCTSPTPCCVTLRTGSVAKASLNLNVTSSVEILNANESSMQWRCIGAIVSVMNFEFFMVRPQLFVQPT